MFVIDSNQEQQRYMLTLMETLTGTYGAWPPVVHWVTGTMWQNCPACAACGSAGVNEASLYCTFQ